MRYTILASFISFGILSAESFFFTYPVENLHHRQRVKRDDGDPGTPLFLTPFIESGNITEGRRLARVLFTESLNITSYAGFFTVNKTYNSNQFFWYFPAMTAPIKEAPVIVWLQGGPGASSLYGLFSENGPLLVKDGKFERRDNTWALNHHIIYIDNPVGTGFSFTNDDGYCSNQEQIGEQLHSTITQFFQLFPELQDNKFFATGESYGGKYVPAFAYTIHKKNPTAALKINLKGISIGDGWSDPENQIIYGKYLQQLGFVDWNQVNVLEDYEKKAKKYIQEQNWDKAHHALNVLFYVINMMTGIDNMYNYIGTLERKEPDDFQPMLYKSDVRKGIHVGNLTFSQGGNVLKYLKEDFFKSVAPLVSELLNHYHVLTYNGQLDIVVSYQTTVNYLRNLNFSGSEEYKTVKRHQWLVGNKTAGYVKQAGNLTEVMVRNAGHMVPTDQPEWALDLITRFTYDIPFFDSVKPKRV